MPKLWVNQKSLLYLKKVKMQSDELIIINRIQKTLKERYHNIGESMMSGTVDNMEKYKYMLGQAHTCLTILQDISNLLNEKEQKDEKGTVIKLDTKS